MTKRRQRTIKVNGRSYVVRGTYYIGDLQRHYKNFVEKFVGTKITFEQWLIRYGKIHCLKREK